MGRCDESLPWRLDVRVKFACLVAYLIATLHASTPLSLGLCVVAAVVVSLAVKVRLSTVARALRPLVVVIAFTALMQLAVLPWEDALVQAAYMAASLACVVSVSIAFMQCTTSDQLMAGFSWALEPLRRAGCRVDAFLLSLCIALRFGPVLVSDFSQMKKAQAARQASFGSTVRESLAAYTRLFPPLIRGSFRRADTLASSFLSRCFGGGIARTSLHQMHVGAADAFFVLIAVALCVVAFLV